MSIRVVKWSEVLNNRASIIIRRFREHMRFAACMVVSFISFSYSFVSILYHCLYGCMFYIRLFNFLNFVFLLLCYVLLLLYMFRSEYPVS